MNERKEKDKGEVGVKDEEEDENDAGGGRYVLLLQGSSLGGMLLSVRRQVRRRISGIVLRYLWNRSFGPLLKPEINAFALRIQREKGRKEGTREYEMNKQNSKVGREREATGSIFRQVSISKRQRS